MFIRVRSQEVPEMTNDGPPDALISDPLYDGFGLDVAQLVQRKLLLHS